MKWRRGGSFASIYNFHGDHFGGLPFFIVDAAKHVKRIKPLTIISPPGCKPKLAEAIELFYPGASEVLEDLAIEFIEYFPIKP